MPIFWECDRCTACCRWPGEVRVSAIETSRISAYLKLEELEFIERYTRLNRERSGLTLIERADHGCIFLDGNDCRIQSVKPQQCRNFPNLWNFPGFEKVCRAKPFEMPIEEWRAKILAATGRAVEEPPPSFHGMTSDRPEKPE